MIQFLSTFVGNGETEVVYRSCIDSEGIGGECIDGDTFGVCNLLTCPQF